MQAYKKYLYQIGNANGGDYILCTNSNIEVKDNVNFKTFIEKTPFGLGAIDLQGSNSSNYDDRTFAIKYLLSSKSESIEKYELLQKMINSGEFLTIWVAYTPRQEVKWYIAYAKAITPLSFDYRAQEQSGEETLPIDYTLRLTYPLFLEINGNDLKYVDLTTLATSLANSYDGSGVTYDTVGVNYDSYLLGVPPISNLTPEQQYNTFTSDQFTLPIWVEDRVFRPKFGDIDTTVQSQTFTVTSGTLSAVSTINQTYQKAIYLIKFTPPSTGQFVEITSSNGTGTRITWLGLTLTNFLVYNSFYNRVFDQFGRAIDVANYSITQTHFSLLSLSSNTTNNILESTRDTITITDTVTGTLTLTIRLYNIIY